MRILLVEDDPMIGASVQKGLQQNGYSVDWVSDGEQAEHALADRVHELVLLDLGLPKKNGFELLEGMRKKGINLPVLIITARDQVSDRVKGLDMGADDYLVKPFDLDELSARIRALTRRKIGHASPIIEKSGIKLNPATHEVSYHEQPVSLSKREFAILQTLMMKPGTPIARVKLEESIYGWGEEIESNTVEVYIHSLRRKLDPSLIRNIRGVGYMIADIS